MVYISAFVPDDGGDCLQSDDEGGGTGDVMSDGVSSSSDHRLHSPNVDGHGNPPSNERPYFQDLHNELRGEVWDGGEEGCMFNSKAGKERYPFCFFP